MQENLRSNIWKYAVLLIANKRIFVAILGAYYLTIPNVTPWWIGTILLIGSLVGFIMEIPSGYISDKIGHKKALVISRVSMIISTIFFLFANNVTFLIIGSVFMSIANAFQSGTDTAFMHETLRGLNREGEYSKIMGKIGSVGFAVPIMLTVLIPFLVGISYKLPFAASLVMDLIGLAAALSLVSPRVSQEHIEEVNVTNFKQVAREGYALNFFRYALFSGILGGAITSMSVFRAPYQSFMEVPVIWFGVFFGIGRAFASLMLAYSGKIKEFTKKAEIFYRYQLVLFAILSFVLGMVSNWIVVVIAFIIMDAFRWGMSRVDEGYLVDIIQGSKFKATLISMRSQIESLVIAGSCFGLGFIIDHMSYQKGFLIISIGFMTVLILLYLYINKSRRIAK